MASEPPDAQAPIEGRWVRERGTGVGDYRVTTVFVDRACAPHVAAPGQLARCSENRGGDFYSDCGSCLFCDLPFVHAPELMAYVKHPDDSAPHCVFTRPPRTPEEIGAAIDAMCDSEVCGIRYGGDDPEILRRIAQRRHPRGQAATDRPLPSG
jgi:hypothetical protein